MIFGPEIIFNNNRFACQCTVFGSGNQLRRTNDHGTFTGKGIVSDNIARPFNGALLKRGIGILSFHPAYVADAFGTKGALCVYILKGEAGTVLLCGQSRGQTKKKDGTEKRSEGHW